MEIERKWLFEDTDILSEYPLLSVIDYAQGYLSVAPEVRIRKKRPHGHEEPWQHAICIKSKGALCRIEFERDITLQEFNELEQVGGFTDDNLIYKIIYNLDVDGYVLTVGITDYMTENRFIYGEIEFESEEQATRFVAPPCFGKEVTYDPSYKMAAYWERTRLQGDSGARC